MRVQPLRAEFAIAGGALLLAMAWGWEALRSVSGWPEFPWVDYFKSTTVGHTPSSGAWIFAAAVAVGAAYVIGAFVVQITFERPTRGIIKALRDERVDELRRLDNRLAPFWPIEAASPRDKLLEMLFAPKPLPKGKDVKGTQAVKGTVDAMDAQVEHQAGVDKEPPASTKEVNAGETRRGLARIFNRLRRLAGADKSGVDREPSLSSTESELVKLVQSLGRAVLSEELNGQYNYRRGNRQVFVGMIPTLFALPVDIGISLMALPLPTWRFIIGSTALVVLAFGAFCFYFRLLLRAAAYQEEIAQGLILDAAFLERWAPSGTPDTRSDAVGQNQRDGRAAARVDGVRSLRMVGDGFRSRLTRPRGGR